MTMTSSLTFLNQNGNTPINRNYVIQILSSVDISENTIIEWKISESVRDNWNFRIKILEADNNNNPKKVKIWYIGNLKPEKIKNSWQMILILNSDNIDDIYKKIKNYKWWEWKQLYIIAWEDWWYELYEYNNWESWELQLRTQIVKKTEKVVEKTIVDIWEYEKWLLRIINEELISKDLLCFSRINSETSYSSNREVSASNISEEELVQIKVYEWYITWNKNKKNQIALELSDYIINKCKNVCYIWLWDNWELILYKEKEAGNK